MVFVVVLCHVVLKSSHLSTSYPGSTRNQRDWRGLPTAGLHFILIRSPCLEDNHSVRTSSPDPRVLDAHLARLVILRASDEVRCLDSGDLYRRCPKNLNLSPTPQFKCARLMRLLPLFLSVLCALCELCVNSCLVFASLPRYLISRPTKIPGKTSPGTRHFPR